MVISEIYCISQRGELIFHKHCKGSPGGSKYEEINMVTNSKDRKDIPKASTEFFIKLVIENKKTILPHMKDNNVSYYHIKRNGLYFVMTTKAEISSILVIEQLTRLFNICKDFCGCVTEESLRSNILLIYELLGEFMDNGYVQQTSTERLKSYIQNDPIVPKLRTPDNMQAGLFGIEYRNVPAPSNAADKPVVLPRSEQEMRKNEIFIDVIERVSFLIESAGTVLRSDLNGTINLKCFLNGTPSIKLGLNEDLTVDTEGVAAYGDHVYLTSCNFHECVRSDEFEEKKILKISPPEGEFPAMTYTQNGDITQGRPFRLVHHIKEDDDKREIELYLRLMCTASSNAQAVKLTVKIPVPRSTIRVTNQLSGPGQSADFSDKDSQITWNLKNMVGGAETIAKFKIGLSGDSKSHTLELGPVAMNFELSGYLCSNLRIKTLRIYEKDLHFQPQQWIRYITVPDSYMIKLH